MCSSDLFDLVRYSNTNFDTNTSKRLIDETYEVFKTLTGLLGLLEEEDNADLDEEIEELIRVREEARKTRDFAKADKIRDDLSDRGIILEDTPHGVRWSRK